MPLPTIGGAGIMLFGRLSVHCPSVNIYFAWCNVSVFNEDISTKFASNIPHVSGRCWKGIRGKRLKVKVMARPINL